MFKIFKNFNNSGVTDKGEPQPPSAIINDAIASEQPTVVAIPTSSAAGDAGSASEQVLDAMAHDRQCTLTIGEAQEMFRTLLRRPLSQRSLQRYCNNSTIAAQMISHSQGKEWLINEASLVRFIEKYPITLTEQPAPMPPHTASQPEPETIDQPKRTATVAPSRPTTPPAAPEPDARSADDSEDAASDDYAELGDTGEKRRMGGLLIENARLLAIIEGNERLIDTLKLHDDRTHEEVTHARNLITKLTDDVAGINSQMLDTMLKMSTSRFMLPAANEDGPASKDSPRRKQAGG